VQQNRRRPAGLRVSIGSVDRSDKHAIYRRLDIAALAIGGVAWQIQAGHHRRPPREDRHAVPALLAPPNRLVARLPDCVRRELGVCGFELLKAHDVGLGFAKPVQQVRQATVDVVDVETGDLHRSATDTRQSWRSASHLYRLRSRFGYGHTTDTSSFHLTARLRSRAGPTIRKSPSFLHNTNSSCNSVLGREIARHPPPPDAAWWGGVAAHREICRAPFFISSVRNNCCDRVAMSGFSSRCQLKSMREKRSRRPLSPEIVWVGGLDRPARAASEDGARGTETGPPGRACRVLFGN
jgi:hypothetical protein